MNNANKAIIRIIKLQTFSFFILFSAITSVYAQENQQGYISDDLSIYMHAGPGTKYRILGTIIAGVQVQITGKSSNDYSEIIDEKNRTAWVESKYLTKQPGLRFVVTDLNSKLTNASDFNIQLDGEINALKDSVASLKQEKISLQTQLNKVQLELKDTRGKVKDQDTNIKKQWFFNGAIVLGLGLLLGLLLPKLFARRRTSMESWG